MINLMGAGGAQKWSTWMMVVGRWFLPFPWIFQTISFWVPKSCGRKEESLKQNLLLKFHIISSYPNWNSKTTQFLNQFAHGIYRSSPFFLLASAISGCSAGRWSATICNSLAGHTFREGADLFFESAETERWMYMIPMTQWKKNIKFVGCWDFGLSWILYFACPKKGGSDKHQIACFLLYTFFLPKLRGRIFVIHPKNVAGLSSN